MYTPRANSLFGTKNFFHSNGFLLSAFCFLLSVLRSPDLSLLTPSLPPGAGPSTPKSASASLAAPHACTRTAQCGNRLPSHTSDTAASDNLESFPRLLAVLARPAAHLRLSAPAAQSTH